VNKHKAWLVIPGILVVVIFYFFYRMDRNDAKALADFPVAYQKYDAAIFDFSKLIFASNLESASVTNDLERKADEALVELKTKASARISSLTKHDGELMSITHEIAAISGKELDILEAYKKAVVDKNADLDQLAKELADLTNKRQTDYARFRELAGLKD